MFTKTCDSRGMQIIYLVRLFAEVCIYGMMYAYIQTDMGHIQHVCVGLAQAHSNK